MAKTNAADRAIATLQGQIAVIEAAIAAIKSAQAAKPVRVKREKKAEPKL